MSILEEQADYYRTRAAEYDEWFLRQGRYDRGTEANQRWFDEVVEVQTALTEFNPSGDILELACGTGLWTERLQPHAKSLTCIDASEEMIAINRARLAAGPHYVQADLFNWQPTRGYDTIFFGFWLSHVPPELFDAFWQMVSKALAPDGRVFFVDSRFEPSSTATDHTLESAAETTVVRKLNDGSEYRIVKVFYEPKELVSRLEELGFMATLNVTPTYFLYGTAQRVWAKLENCPDSYP